MYGRWPVGGGRRWEVLEAAPVYWDTITKRASRWETLQQTISEQDFINYLDRTRLFGEDNAMRWLTSKYGDVQPDGATARN